MPIRESEGAHRQFSAESWAARRALLTRAFGVVTESSERAISVSGTAQTTGRQYGVAIPLLKGDRTSQVAVEVIGAGVGITLCKAALYRVAPDGLSVTQILAQTADFSSAIGSVGDKVALFTAEYVSQDDEVVMGMVLAVGTTAPGFAQSHQQNPVGGVLSGGRIGPWCVSNATGLTDLMASGTVNYSATSNGPYMALLP